MRSLADAKISWDELKRYPSLADLKEAVRLDGHISAPNNGLRSACWKAFLLFDNIDIASWPRTLLSSRSAYNSLRMHFLRHLENPEEQADPLSEETDSPWSSIRQDEELRAEIQQDVDRCMPENLYFRQPDTQRMLLDILFVFCKLNPDLGYRQGMHELLAPILWVVERDALNLGQSSKAMGEDAVIRTVYDAEHIEHDAFALFGQVMQNAKTFYEQTNHAATENPMVSRSKRIVFELLPQVDPDLAKHMEKLDIMPQVFLMRWVRLLFGREFPFDDVLTMWDVIFANDTTLEIVEHVCLAMILRIRWELMDSDYNAALTLLLRYPPLPKDLAPQSLVLDALYLREHMHTEGGGYLVLKYTDRPLQPGDRPATPPALQRNITAFSGVNAAKAALSRAGGSPDTRPKQARNIESLFQSAAKNIHARSEQLGIGKAVRNAVDEVHRKAQEISNAPTPSPSNTWRQRGPRTAYGAVLQKVKELETRNAQLGKLLEAAVSDLWEFQKDAAEGDGADKPRGPDEARSQLEKLSVAIAKAQFVQVYLSDSSLPLPVDDADKNQRAEHSGASSPPPEKQGLEEKQEQAPISPSKMTPVAEEARSLTSHDEEKFEKLADPSTFDDPDDDAVEPETDPTPSTNSQPEIHIDGTATEETAIEPPPAEEDPLSALPSPQVPRPTLAESSYSWMLSNPDKEKDQEHSDTNSRKTTPSFFEDQRRNRGFLFGDEDPAANDDEPALKVVSSKKGRAHKKNASSTSKVAGDDEKVVLGMDDLSLDKK
ncbi:hypothetical protein Q7P37_004089 [Cladosporium fusiforme]